MAHGKRYGHNSLLGATLLISVDNGWVLDYSVKSKTCSVCKQYPNPTAEWKENHAPDCEINHIGSSGSMERGDVEMFLRSVDKHNLKYTLVMEIPIHLVQSCRLYQKNLVTNTRLQKQIVLVTFKSGWVDR